VARTVATVTLTACGLSILALLAPPREHGHYLLIIGLAAGLVACLVLPGLRAFFELRLPSIRVWVAVALVIVAAHVLLRLGSRRALRSDQNQERPAVGTGSTARATDLKGLK
jgi:asparagine N-glycosylation enzyme membrane subunit Stt3